MLSLSQREWWYEQKNKTTKYRGEQTKRKLLRSAFFFVKNELSKLKDKLDRAIQLYYVPLNPNCLVCGQPTAEMHHFVQKKQSERLRYDPINLIPLCKSCHCSHHRAGDPNIVAKILKVKGFAWQEDIQAKRREMVKQNKSYKEELSELLKKLTRGIK